MNYLIGASGHGLVILNILSLQNIEVDSFLDDGIKPNLFAGKPCRIRNSININSNDKVLISIGNNVIRKKIENSLKAKSLNLCT